MSFRIEEKLYIKSENLIDFKEYLLKKSAKKLYESREIQSLYFDNHNLQMYNDSIEGLVPRKKIRIRNYPNNKDNKIYFEVKNSSIEGRFKTREIINNDSSEEKISKGVFDNQYGLCSPKIFVKYNREYYLIKDVRISVDTNIFYNDYKTNYQVSDDRVIAELKTSITKNIDELVEDFPTQRIRFSKYCFGVERLYHL